MDPRNLSCWIASAIASLCGWSCVVADPDPIDEPLARVRPWPSAESLEPRAELPDPFRLESGERVGGTASWSRRREEMKALVLWHEYGHMPPAPGNVEAREVSSTRVFDGAGVDKRIVLGFGPRSSVSLRVAAIFPVGDGPFPVIVKNDVALGAVPIAERLVRAGYIVVDYLREDLDPDKSDVVGPAQAAYPGFDWGTIAVWAWGGMRVVDWLVTLDDVDPRKIAVTGHSRGGKTALLHGAFDERIAVTNPNGSGAGGAGSYRVLGPKCETLDLITLPRRFGYWFHPRLREFVRKEDRLPFDQHFVTALVAPRALLATDALGDTWANPRGTIETFRASKEVYGLLGAESRVGLHFREGEHDQSVEDWRALFEFLELQYKGEAPGSGRRFDGAHEDGSGRTFGWSHPAKSFVDEEPGAPRVLRHVPVYKASGRFGGWPANHGIWSWGDEILVGFSVGYHANLGDRHNIDREKPEEHWLARSFDGGESWTLEHPGARGFLVPRGRALHGTEPSYLRGESPSACPGGIVFTHPDLALTARMTDNDVGPSYFHCSLDRGRTWNGPFDLPAFGTPGIAARTDYLIGGPNECTLFLTAAKADREEGRPLCVRTVDGGKTWKLLSMIGPEPKGFSIMPASARLSNGDIVVCVRRREGPKRWIDAHTSSDDGKTWSELPRPVDDAGVGNPPSLVRLKDDRLCLTWGFRAPPYEIRAKLSADGGKSWSETFVVRGDGGGRDMGYVRSVQRSDGNVVSVYYVHDEPGGDRYIEATIWSPGR